ncbi:cytochrome c [Dyella sp. C9]|uniref:cytochrome c n=1 Tax=Dyella sp. C9 TaxID=2202154 RepID=UPI000DEF66D1|nr:cytochrome c [Dyella sp. C9]
MRAALLIVLGLAIGILGTVFSMNALHEHEPLSHSVMKLMGHHAGALNQAVKTNQCDAPQVQQHLTRLLETSADITEAFPGVDKPFLDEAAKLHQEAQAAVQATPTTCAALAQAIRPVNETCKSCHEQYR